MSEKSLRIPLVILDCQFDVQSFLSFQLTTNNAKIVMILSCTMKMLTYLTKAKICLKMSPFENRDTEREATHQTGKQATVSNPHVPRILTT